MIDLSQSPSFDSSFTPLSKYATSQKVSQALEYWKVKRNKKPKTLVEYLRFNGLLSAPKGKKIVLYNNENIPYEVIINNDGQIEIPDSVIEINHGAFNNCIILEEIRMPRHLTRIYLNTFNGCKKLKKINDIEILEVSHMSRKTIMQGTEEIPIEYYYTEISLADVDKWNAIEFLIKKLGIKPEEVIAIGDNINDKKMIE